MKRYVIFSFFFFILFVLNAQVSMTEIRVDFYEIKTENQLDFFIEKTKKCSSPEAVAYLASSLMWKAKFSFFPNKKFSFFKKGKQLLENLIDQYPTMIEARYIRALLKSQSPKFLGYHNGFQEDLNFVKKNLEKSDLPKEYKNKMNLVLKKYNLL